MQTFNETVGSLTLSGGSIIGTGTLTSSSYTFESGSISAPLGGAAALTVNSSGTVTLNSANTFIGSTTVSAGTLQVNTNNALGRRDRDNVAAGAA